MKLCGSEASRRAWPWSLWPESYCEWDWQWSNPDNLVDCHSREALCSEVDTSLTGQRVVRVLQWLGEIRGLPQTIQVDNGPEFTGRALDRVPPGRRRSGIA